MSGSEQTLPDRVRRAFRAHDSFTPAGEAAWTFETTAFDATVTAAPTPDDDPRVRYDVVVRVPTLSAVTAEHVASVVEEGWTETFERRVVDVGGVTRGDHTFDPTVAVADEELIVRLSVTDSNARRSVDDAGALIDFVEGTYVQGVIPGYEYTEPVDSLISSARQQGGGGPF